MTNKRIFIYELRADNLGGIKFFLGLFSEFPKAQKYKDMVVKKYNGDLPYSKYFIRKHELNFGVHKVWIYDTEGKEIDVIEYKDLRKHLLDVGYDGIFEGGLIGGVEE